MSQLEKINKIIGDNVKLFAMRGVPLNIRKEIKKDSDDYYYTFDLKVVQPSDLEYNTSYDLFHVVVPSHVAMTITDTGMKAMKDSEVLVLLNPSCRLRSYKSDEPDANGEVRTIKYNQANFYALELLKLRDMSKAPERSALAYNL